VNRVEIAQQRVLCMVLCAEKDASREEVEKAANCMVPAGTSGGWFVPEEYDGGPNPVGACDENEDRVHWYVTV
jgi:hypothetical protein